MFAAPVIALAIRLARPLGATVDVLSIARIWGSGFGFPNPWLLPSRRELDAQQAIVSAAVMALRAAGLEASGRIAGTRNAAGRIAKEARRGAHDAVVLGADPPRGRLVGELLWSQEPQRAARKCAGPVYLVPVVETALPGAST